MNYKLARISAIFLGQRNEDVDTLFQHHQKHDNKSSLKLTKAKFITLWKKMGLEYKETTHKGNARDLQGK